MRTLFTAITATLLGLVLLAGPASAGQPPECGPSPSGSGEGECTLVIGGDDATVTGSGSLPVTGSDSLPLVQIGVVLLAIGGFVVLVVRKRSNA